MPTVTRRVPTSPARSMSPRSSCRLRCDPWPWSCPTHLLVPPLGGTAVIAYASADGGARLYQGDSRSLAPIGTGSVGIVLTSPTYWITDESRASADRYARRLAVEFGSEWQIGRASCRERV